MGPIALDTNVVIGFLDPDDDHHDEARRAMREYRDAPKSMSTIAYSELLVHPVAEGRTDGIERFMSLAGVELVPFDRAIAERTAQLRARFQAIRLPDAGVLASALARGAFLVTFDAQLSVARDRVP